MCARQASSTSVGAWIGCLAAGLGGGRRLTPNPIPDARRAVQGGQRQVSPPYPEAEASADELSPPNPEAAAMPFDDRQQGGHIGGVAGPQEGGDRPVLLIQHDAQHDLIDTSK
jgi:hypothetical protein